MQLGEDSPGLVLASMLQQIEGKADTNFADLVTAGKFGELQNAFIASMDKVWCPEHSLHIFAFALAPRAWR